MPASRRKKIAISTLIPFLVFILLFSSMIWQKYRSSHEVPVISPQQFTEGTKSIILFFSEGGARLVRETRTIDSCETDTACLKSVLDELLNGPVGEFEETIPEGTATEAVSIEGNQAIIEFNRSFSDAMPSGSSAEMLAVYSVINTIAVNFPYIQSVKLNIDGKTDIQLRHLDLSDPLLPDYSLEQAVSTLHEKSSAVIPANHKGVPR